ncbi:MAG: glycosyltransferase family 2 protein [Anaerolineales bacterium]|nr:glycosyltransferase family 2 protein [Anaerolineales bacterium]
MTVLSFIIAMFFWFSVCAILYTYFGYPILIWLMPSFNKNNSQSIYTPSVTLLIAAYNEKNVIEEKIKNSLAIEYPKGKLQILLITDGSNDGTEQVVKPFEKLGITLLHQPERKGKMAAINRAMPYAIGEIIVFSDANNFYKPNTIQKLAQPFVDPQVGAVSGSKTIEKGDGELGNSEGLYWKYESFIKKQESRVSSCTSVAGEILAIRKNLYSTPPNHIINDDFFSAMQTLRQGYKLVYVEDAKSTERISPSAKDEMIRRRRINAGRYQAISMSFRLLPKNPILIWQIVSHKYLRPLVPFFMIIVFILNLFAVLIPYPRPNDWLYLSQPFGLILLILQTIFYLMAIVGMKIEKQQGNSRLRLLFYLPTFLVNSNFAALQGFFQFIKGGQGHLWQKVERR